MADGRPRVSSSDDELSSNDSSSGVPHSYVAGLMASTHDEYTQMTRNSSQLDLTGAYISEDEEPGTPGDNPTESASAWKGTPEAPSIGLPQQTVDDVSHFSIDIGGSLIKLVYFSSDRSTPNGGRLHFKKWETKHYRDCINYIKRKRLHLSASGKQVAVKATGGGAYKFQEEFREQLGIELQKQDEMRSLVAGSDFFLRAIEDEVFTFQTGVRHYVQDQPIYPYLLVNIGSGVSIVKVEAEGVYERISGTNIGGGTFWGLCRLLTGVNSFDEMLKLSAQGDNTAVDMLVGDIYGGNDYSSVGLAATTIASSFGKVVMDDSFSPSDYKPEDIALSLLRMISYNIAQVAVLNAMKFKLQRLMFGGFFIRGHPYTMETISYAIKFWSKGEHQAMFMRHEGFLGAMGAFLLSDTAVSKALTRAVSEAKGSWVEKFIRSARNNGSHSATGERFQLSSTPPRTSTLGCSPRHSRALMRESVSGTFDLGVLHLMPSLQCFPLLAQPTKYTADTFNLTSKEDRQYWIQSFRRHQPSLVGKALASSGAGAADDVSEEHRKACEARAAAFDTAFCEHLDKLEKDPSAFGRSSLNAIFEFREECLRVNGFPDAYAPDKAKENAAALEALPDLLEELDRMAPDDRLLALVEGTLAGNIFDWGSNACVELYQNDTILEMYRKARAELRRPWIVDDFEAVKLKLNEMQPNGSGYKKAVILLDNSGADAVLGIIPLARELARRGATVVLAANSLPALNDITDVELKQVMELAAQVDPVLKEALEAGVMTVIGNGSGSPCINLRLVSEQLATAAVGCDLLIIEGMGRAVHTNLHATFTADCLKLAMIKNQRVAEQLFKGNIYDCMCKFQPGRPASSTSSVSSQKGG